MSRSFQFANVTFLVATCVAGCSAPGKESPSSPRRHATSETSDAASNGCPSDTGFTGDDMCLSPPGAERGFQLHYGPSDYGSSDVSPFVLTPGRETVDCFYEKTSNASDVYVSGYEFHMRPGSHHLLVNVNPVAQADGFADCLTNDMSPGLLGGTQTPELEELRDPAPENEGLAVRLPAHSQAVINFHVIDSGVKPLLREAWLNYMYIDESAVKGIRGNVFLTGGLGFHIPPQTQQTYTYSCSPDRPVRVLSLAAHMHAHATRLSAWKVSAGTPTPVYEAYDWAEPPLLKYDSVHQNAPADRVTKTPGGSSGALVIEPGDTLQWECAVNNTSADVLTFRNEVNTGEMCILAGIEVPADDPMTPYDFTCSRQ